VGTSNSEREIMTRGRIRPQTFHAVVALCITVVLMLLLLLLIRPAFGWGWYLGLWLLSINATAFGYYGYDKRQAKVSGPRVPEVVLHGLAVVGGSLGAYAGMQIFRHKTIKGPFRIVFWFTVVLQIMLIGALIYRYFTHTP